MRTAAVVVVLILSFIALLPLVKAAGRYLVDMFNKASDVNLVDDQDDEDHRPG